MLFLPWVGFKVKIRAFFWQKQIKKKYYNNLLFSRVDQDLLNLYQVENPYKISSAFMKAKGDKEIHVFGETPLHIYDQIINRWKIHKNESFLELGSGTGRGLFFLSNFYGYHCIGIEWIARFVTLAKEICEKNQLKNVTFLNQDFFYAESIKAEMIYFYSLCLSDSLILKMCNKFAKDCNRNTKFITVSFPLSDYDSRFTVKDQFEAVFPWGKGLVFLNQIQ